MKSEQTTYSSIPTAEAVPATTMVEVIAPATLKAGYIFNAKYDGIVFPVVVPNGGVTQGQTLVVPFNPNKESNSKGVGIGLWKDDICACTRYGIFHPSFINACCIPLILLGQVMTRMKLDWRGRPAPAGEWSKTFHNMVYITLVYIVAGILFSPAAPEDEPSALYNLISFSYGLFLLVLVTKVRRIVRERNQISETRCIGCEDCCCAFWCGCCTVSQLARQTADYDSEDGRFFTNDGLSPRSPPVIVV